MGLKAHPLLWRLAAIAVIGAGLWFWTGGAGIFPVARELVWRAPEDAASVREVEIQIYDGDQLLKRELFSFPQGMAADIEQKLPLRNGDYQARVFIRRSDGSRGHRSLTVQVQGGGPVALTL